MSGNYIDVTEDPTYREGFADGRKEALLEACGAICPECAKGSRVLSNEEYPDLFHVIEGKGAVDCLASEIHKLSAADERK